MQIVLTVRSKNFNAYSPSKSIPFDPAKMTNVIINIFTANPLCPGVTQFDYFPNPDQSNIPDTYTVDESTGYIATQSGGTANSPVGTVQAGVTVVESGTVLRKTTFTIAAFTQAVTNAALGWGKQLYVFPKGVIKIQNVQCNLTMSAPTNTNVGVVGMGTVVASGAVAVLSGTSTFVDVVSGQATGALSVAGTVTKATAAATAGLLDGSTTAKNLFLNFAGTQTAAENVTISGTVTIDWEFVGNY
jgi:hypothetical protein